MAAEIAGGAVRAFDDLGCLLRSMRRGETVPERVWVHDVESAEWLDAATAHFVRDDGLTTPMGFGIVALANEEAARRSGGPTPTVYDWEDLVAAGGALIDAPGERFPIDQPLSEENGR